MKGNPEERAIARSAAKAFGISKSTVDKDVCSYDGGMAHCCDMETTHLCKSD
ncbi:MAG: sporulation transcriptional regulator SpoIIID [Ruthenibacterium sp.]